MHKKDPKTGKDTEELAIITQLPVWGFCRKAPNGNWVWLKDNDPIVRIQREINQGRLAYVNTEKEFRIADTEDAGSTEAEAAATEETHSAPKIAGEAPAIDAIG